MAPPWPSWRSHGSSGGGGSVPRLLQLLAGLEDGEPFSIRGAHDFFGKVRRSCELCRPNAPMGAAFKPRVCETRSLHPSLWIPWCALVSVRKIEHRIAERWRPGPSLQLRRLGRPARGRASKRKPVERVVLFWSVGPPGPCFAAWSAVVF